MSRCKQCGVEIFPGDQFCHACGADLEGNIAFSDNTPAENQSKLGKNENKKLTKKPKVKRRTWLYLIIFISVTLIAFVLVRFVFPPVSVPTNMISDNTDEFADSEVDENTLSVSPTLTAFALENLSESSASEVVETVEPTMGETETELTLIFSEDFEGNTTSAVPLYSDEYMNFYTVSGQGFLSGGYSVNILPIVFPDVSIADFIAEFDCMMPEAYEDTSFGFIFRADEIYGDELDRYYALEIIPQQNSYIMELYIDKNWYATDVMQFEVPIKTGYEMNHIRMEVIGSQMNLFVNGEFEIGLQEDSILDAGLMGFFISPSMSLPEGSIDTVILDNFKVYQP